MKKTIATMLAAAAGVLGFGAESPYGVCAHLQRWEYDRAAEELKLMKAGGIDSVRFDLDWDAMESSPGVWNFERMDSLVAMAREHNVRILPIIAYDVKWATPAWKHLPEFLNYVEVVVKRYGADMPVMEIWNEENLPGFWRGKPSGKEYASLLIPTYRKIKELNPEIKVAYGGTAGIPLDFIEESFRAGAAEAMDVMCIHPYRLSETPELSLATDLAALHELMERYGVGDKPVWFTEMGYSTVEPLPFLSAVLPRLFAALEMKPEATECVTFSDDEYLYYTETPGFQLKLLLPEVKSVRSVTLKELKNLKAAPDTLLVLPTTESFPAEFVPELKAYLRNGGRLLSPGGLPLYFDLRRDSETGKISKVQVNDRYMKPLHLSWYTFWTRPGTPEKLESLELAEPYAAGPAVAFLDGFRFFDGGHLAEEDRFEPVLYGRRGEFRGAIAGVYHLNSDLKGKIAVCGSLPQRNEGVPEAVQAELLPRTMLIAFACGIERVYWYSFRSTEWAQFDREAHFGIIRNDLQPKAAYHACRTLSRMYPAGSTRPVIRSEGSLHVANWKTPDGNPVAAVWTVSGERPVSLAVKRGTLSEVRDLIGEKRELSAENGTLRFTATPGVLYFSGVEL